MNGQVVLLVAMKCSTPCLTGADVWKCGEKRVILVSGVCDGTEMRCLGIGWAQLNGHKTISIEVN